MGITGRRPPIATLRQAIGRWAGSLPAIWADPNWGHANDAIGCLRVR